MRNSPIARIDSDGHGERGHYGESFELLKDWGDVIEFSWSSSVGFGGEYSWGPDMKGSFGVGAEVQQSIGLGGGNKEHNAFVGVHGDIKAGKYGASGRVGGEVTPDGVQGKGSGKVSGPGGTNVEGTVDSKGKWSVNPGVEHQSDSKYGGHIRAGEGVGVAVNTTQAGFAYDQTVGAAKSKINQLQQKLSDFFNAAFGGK